MKLEDFQMGSTFARCKQKWSNGWFSESSNSEHYKKFQKTSLDGLGKQRKG